MRRLPWLPLTLATLMVAVTVWEMVRDRHDSATGRLLAGAYIALGLEAVGVVAALAIVRIVRGRPDRAAPG